MTGILVRLLINAVALWVASALVSGMEIHGTGTLLVAALLLGIVNAILRPIFILLTLPITIMTLGIFLLVVNAAMLGLVAAMLQGLVLHGFWPAFWGAVIVSLVSWIGNRYIGDGGRFEFRVIQHDRRH
ncbi:MAG: phage holin family protein [Candidatus Eiseniibacteriota bacterium]|jgi:putative membrane protein